MKNLLLLSLLLVSLISTSQEYLGFEYGCVSNKEANEESPTGKFGLVHTTPYTYVVFGINAPHERHPVFNDVQHRIHAGIYTKLGIGIPFFNKRLSIYPNWVYSTKYYNIAKNSLIYKNEHYFGVAFRYTDPKYRTGLTLGIDKRNIVLGMSFKINN